MSPDRAAPTCTPWVATWRRCWREILPACPIPIWSMWQHPGVVSASRLLCRGPAAATGPSTRPRWRRAELDRLTLLVAPSLHLLACRTPASRIWRAHQPGHEAELGTVDVHGGPEWLAIYLRPQGHCIDPLSAAEYTLLERCMAGLTLARALEGLSDELDVSLCLPRWSQAGLLAGLSLAP